MGFKAETLPAANTQAFVALMTPVIAAQRAATSGTTQISNADIMLAKIASGAEPSTQGPSSS